MMACKLVELFIVGFFIVNPISAQEEDRDEHDSSTISAIEKIKKSVVAIYAIKTDFIDGRETKSKSGGSGFIVDPEGYLITNYHVAADATKFRVVLWDKQELGAILIGADARTDIAVLQLSLDELKGTSLSWASLGDSDKVVQGESVVSIGMPAGLERTATKGIVSTQSNDRSLRNMILGSTGHVAGRYYNPIQHDSAVGGGSSGGPVCNMKGEVIGINNSKLSNFAGFAIPINVVKDVFRKILKQGEVVRSYTGMDFQELGKYSRYLGVKGGVLVSHVDKNSPADTAGVKIGYIILKLNGEVLNAPAYTDLPRIRNKMGNLDPDNEYSITVLKDGIEKEITLRTTKLDPYVGETLNLKEWGAQVRGMTTHMALKRNMNVVEGVIIANLIRPRGMKNEVGPAYRSGLRLGDLVIRMGGMRVDSLDTFKELYREWVENKRKIDLVVRRGTTIRLIILSPDENLKIGG